jgi:hypothetical protein
VRESEDGRQLEKVMTDTGSGSGGGGIGDTGSDFSTTTGHNQTATENSISGPTVSSSSTVTSPTVERERSANRSDGERMFRFNLDFDPGRRQLQALSMIQEWARNSVSLGIPSLSPSSSNEGEPSNNERVRLAHRTQTDTQIMMPTTSGQAGASPSNSNTGFGGRSRGSLPHLNRTSGENDPEISALSVILFYNF